MASRILASDSNDKREDEPPSSALVQVDDTIRAKSPTDNGTLTTDVPISSTLAANAALEHTNWVIMSETLPSDIPETELERVLGFLKLIKEAPSKDAVPLEIFYIDLSTWNYIKIQSGFQLKYAASVFASITNCIPTGGLTYILKSVVTPTVFSRFQALPIGDAQNFPEYTLDEIYQIFDGIPNRNTFKGLALPKRTKDFITTNGLQLTTKGYEGYAIIEDVNYGSTVGRPGQEHQEILKNMENPLNCIVSHDDDSTPRGWLEKYFKIGSSNRFRKLENTCNKDSFGNTWILYELPAGGERMILKVMRKPKEEYENKIAEWNAAWLRQHPSTKLNPTLIPEPYSDESNSNNNNDAQ